MFEGQVIGHYRILTRLGEGGMGVVYQAEDTYLGRLVALKFPGQGTDTQAFRTRFLREARAISALNHPHIATVHDFGETPDGDPFIVMELIAGRDLGQILKTDGLTITRTLAIVADVADALAEAHRHNIIHRDIKPSNIMVDERDWVKVLDFGLAKLLAPAAGAIVDQQAQTLPATQTRSGVLVGTPFYLSPEQVAGEPVDARSDLFALAAVLYECLTGRPPFPGQTLIEICAAVLHVEPPPPSQVNPRVPPALDQLVQTGLAKQAAARYQSAAEFAAALRAAQTDAHDASLSPTRQFTTSLATVRERARRTVPDALRRPRFSPIFIITLLLALSGALLGARWLLRATPPAPKPDALHWYQIGENALRAGTYYQARRALELAIKIDDKFALAHARLAEAYMELDNKERAAAELLQVHALVADRSALQPAERLYIEAITAMAAADFAQATEKYQALIKLNPERPEVYVDLGRAYEKNADVKNAIANYEAAAQLDQQYATASLRLGSLYGRRQQQAESDAALAKADEIYQAQGNVEGRAEVHYQRGFFLLTRKMNAEAHTELQQARELAHAGGNETQETLAMLQLSNAFAAEGNFTQAQQLATEAVNLAKQNNMPNIAMRGLIDLGNAFLSHGDLTAASKLYAEALADAVTYQDRRFEARARLASGNLEINRGDLAQGLQNVKQALAYYQSAGYRNEATIALILIGQAQRKQGEYAEALRTFNERLQLAQQGNVPREIADTQTEIGKVYLWQEKFPESLTNLQASFSVYQKLADQKSIGNNLVNRGDALWQLGQYAEAAVLFEQAFSIATRADGYQPLLIAVYQSRAEMLLSRGQHDAARSEMQEALNRLDAQDTADQIAAQCLFGLAATRAGDKRTGLQLSQAAYDKARHENNQKLLLQSQLALAEALLAGGAAQQARELALQAQESFAHAEQRESEWRAWLIAARASQLLNDPTKAYEYATTADTIFSTLAQQWQAAGYAAYGARPDVRVWRAQLTKTLANHPQ